MNSVPGRQKRRSHCDAGLRSYRTSVESDEAGAVMPITGENPSFTRNPAAQDCERNCYQQPSQWPTPLLPTSFMSRLLGFLRSSSKAMFSPSVAHFRTPCLDCGHLQPTSCRIQCGSSLGSTVPIPFETVEELLGTEEQGVLSNVGIS